MTISPTGGPLISIDVAYSILKSVSLILTGILPSSSAMVEIFDTGSSTVTVSARVILLSTFPSNLTERSATSLSTWAGATPLSTDKVKIG